MGKRRKSDMAKDLAKQIKEMERKAREQAQASAPVVVIEDPSQEPKLSFDEWWMTAAKKHNFKAHMKEIIQADFKARGLRKHEPLSKFTWALGQYGVK